MEHFFDVFWKFFQDLFLRLGAQNGFLGLVFELRNLAPQRVFLEVGLLDPRIHLEVSCLRLFEQLPLDFTPVADEELLFVYIAPLRMSLRHVASKLLWSFELTAADSALVHGEIGIRSTVSLFLTLFGLPLIFGDRLLDSLYLLLLIFERFKNV